MANLPARLWLGAEGQFEEQALNEGILRTDFGVDRDISRLNSREELAALPERLHPDAKASTIRSFASRVYRFSRVVAVGNLVVSPIRTTATLAIGEFSGP